MDVVSLDDCYDESLQPRGSDTLRSLFDHVEPRPGQVAVDVGCGDGEDSLELARRFGLRVHGVDPVARHVDVATAAASEAGLQEKVTFALGVAERIPLPDGSADIICAGGRRLVHAARLLRDRQRYIDEFGEANYRIMLADCLWHVHRMIGRLHGAAFVFTPAPAHR